MNEWKPAGSFIALAITLMLVGCGSGNGSSNFSQNTASRTIFGVAAAGAPLSGTVYLKDSSNPAKEISSSIAADGSFSFNIDGLSTPFLLKAVGTVNGNDYTLFSFADSTAIANINPLSHLAVVDALGSDDLASLYDNPDPVKMQAIKNSLSNSIGKIQAVLQPTLFRFEADNANVISDSYVANHQGLDLFLDLVSISASNGNVIIIDKTTNNTISGLINSFFANQIDIIPSVPGINSVCILPGVAFVPTLGTVNFRGVVVGTSNQQVIWSVVEANGGAITSSGVYSAPASAGTYHVRATSVADAAKSETATVTVASSFEQEKTWKITATIDPANSFGTVYDVAIAGNRVYTAEGTDGLRIFDTKDPLHPQQIGAVPSSNGFTTDALNSFYHVAVSGNIAAITGEYGCSGFCSGRYYFVELYDVSNPSIPKHLSTKSISTYDLSMILEGRYLYYTIYDRNTSQTIFQVVDIIDPTNPRVVGSVPIRSQGYRVKIGDDVYASNCYTNPEIISVADPANPVVLFSPPENIGNYYYNYDPWIAGLGNNLFVGGANGSAFGYRLIDISNTGSPVVVGDLPSVQGLYPFITDHYLYTAEVASVNVYEVSDPTNPNLITSITTSVPIKLFSFSDRVGVIVSQEVYEDHGSYQILLKGEQISFFAPGQ